VADSTDSPGRTGSSAPLSPEHFTALARFRIASDLLASAGVYSVSDEEARQAGFRLSSARDLSGVVFPYPDPLTGDRVTARLRRDNPDVDGSGKPLNKYVSPFGDVRHLYFPPGAGLLLDDVSIPVVVVEAEKSVLAVSSMLTRARQAFLIIGLGGCWGWRGKVGATSGSAGERRDVYGPLPDLDRIRWPQRLVIIALDANVKSNLDVKAARRELAKELDTRGASVKFCELPALDGVNGPDDFIAICGDDAMLAALDSAQCFAETSLREAEAAVAALEADKKLDPLPALQSIASVTDRTRQDLLKGKVIAFRIPGLNKAVIDKSLAARRLAEQEHTARVLEAAQRERLLRLELDPAQLILQLEGFYADRRHLPSDAAFVEALFCLNSYCFELFETTPYVLYDSATGGCGKSTSLERHELLCSNAYMCVDPTAAVVFRRIERDRPTFLLDEARLLQALHDRGQELLALFDAGYKKGAVVSRCVEHGDEIRDFQIYCPKVLARIGGFRGTLLDRGIVIHLEKARGLRQRRRVILASEAAPLKEKAEAYVLQYQAQLKRSYADTPEDGYWPELYGREEEIWAPLLLHARLAGPEIEKRAIEVARRYSKQKGEVAVTADRTLGLTREAFEVLQSESHDVFSPKDLVSQLREKEVWGEYLSERKNDKACVTAIGTFFGNFRVTSRRHTKFGTEYGRLDVMAALERHLPATSELEEGVTVSADTTTILESIKCAGDTLACDVSPSESSESTEVTVAADTVTPDTRGAAVVEEEL
jgi:hypothetical protein